ncbi:MAG TPA: MarR family transcriptional regulator [Candidatus Kryptonia bacterium]|nr:MarR family transcriptional regulator [Candidatus Kryptonia bacterium]
MTSEIRNLARFRYAVRKLLRASEEAARKVGLTPQHHQLLLGVAGFTGDEWATVGDLAEFLQVRHHSVVGLLDRAEGIGLVRRTANPEDRREVRVSVTADGNRKLRALASLHRKELNAMRRTLDLLDVEERRTRRGGRRKRERVRARAL